MLNKHFHFQQWTFLKPLDGEPLGHIDMFLTMAAKNIVLVGSCDPLVDATNAAILDENAQRMNELKVDDEPMKVVRVPMPSHEDGNWRTYTNVIYANGVVLVPQYPDCDPAADKQALEIYQQTLPGWKVIGIDSSKLIQQRGALHCISLNIPLIANFPDSM